MRESITSIAARSFVETRARSTDGQTNRDAAQHAAKDKAERAPFVDEGCYFMQQGDIARLAAEANKHA